MIGNKFLSVAGASEPTDAQFNYVTMLLHGDGTNGAQNNTFVDSSTNNFTITRNGNTTQGSFSPYGDGWSNFFDGVGDYLANTSTALITAAVSTFTVEAWIFMTANPTSDANNLGSIIALDGEPANTTNYLSFGPISTRKLRIRWFDGASKYAEGSTTLSLNTWYHVAVVVNSNAITMYVNGVAETLSGTTTLTARSGTSGQFSIGAHYYSTFWGYMSNLRVTTTAVYTSAFTPSTTPLTNITNTKILTCQSNRFVDNSSNAYALTLGGTPLVQRFNPFGTSTAYSTATIGGSGYFDGTGDYLTTPSNAVFGFGTGDFTVECWCYLQSGTKGLFGFNGTDSGVKLLPRYDQSSVWQIFSSGSFAYTSSNTLPPYNTWNHVALVRSSGTLKLYVNGVSIYSVADTTNYAQCSLAIGYGYTTTYMLFGNIADLRVVKGTAVYTTNFTPTTAPMTAVSGTSLLLNYTNAAIYDNAMMNDLETGGTAQISTSVKKYGTGSLYFDGTVDYLAAPNKIINSLYSGAFTIEFWMYRIGNGSGGTGVYDAIFGSNTGSTSIYGLYIKRSDNTLGFYNSAGLVTTSNSVSNTTWTHVAVCRTAANNLQIFINGVSGYSASNTGTGTLVNPFYIGVDGTGGNGDYYGYIDDLRITKGVARYTANFTPPTAALPDKGPI